MFDLSLPASADVALDNAKQRAVQALTALPLYRSSSSSTSSSRQRSDSDIEHPSPVPSNPSHVAWRSGSGNPSYSPSFGAPPIGRSASSPPLAPHANSRSKMYKHGSLRSTHSLRLESRYISNEGHSLPAGAPLSPIVEQDYFSPERRSIPLPTERSDTSSQETRTPAESDVTDVARPSPVYSTFLSRPLNRSISQSSSRTHLSSASTPPSIPPLDLHPQFPPPNLGGQPLRAPRHGGLTVPTLPTIVGTPNDGVYDDTSSVQAESFTTARSATSPTNAGDAPPSASTEETDIGVTGRTRYQRPSLSPVQYSEFERGSQAELGSIRSMATDSTPGYQSRSSSSSFLDRRWLKGVPFGGAPAGLPERKAWQPHIPNKAACILFWVGFIAPWCWLIGGWLLNSRGETKSTGERLEKAKGSGLLPLWSVERLKKTQEGKKQGSLVMLGYPFIAPSIISLPGSSLGRTPSFEAPPQMRVHWKWEGSKVLDPWVVRCRVAAVTSGFVIAVAFVVAIIVVAKD